RREADQLREEMLEQERRGKQALEKEVADRRKSEQQLRNSESLYQSLVDNLDQLLIRKDLQGRFTFANEAFCRFYGTTVDKLIGKTNFDIVSREFAEEI